MLSTSLNVVAPQISTTLSVVGGGSVTVLSVGAGEAFSQTLSFGVQGERGPAGPAGPPGPADALPTDPLAYYILARD